jgi:hypothetical protein
MEPIGVRKTPHTIAEYDVYSAVSFMQTNSSVYWTSPMCFFQAQLDA